MLRHLDLADFADRVESALLATLAAGVRTSDIGGTAGTREFAEAISGRLRGLRTRPGPELAAERPPSQPSSFARSDERPLVSGGRLDPAAVFCAPRASRGRDRNGQGPLSDRERAVESGP